jgi:hypothetical protein
MKKRFIGLALLALVVYATLVYAEVFPNPVTFTDKVWFRSNVDINSPVASRTATLWLGPNSSVVLEGATDNAYETTLALTDPTADRTQTLPNASGQFGFTGGYSVSSSVGYTAGTGISLTEANLLQYTTFFVTTTAIGASCSSDIGPSDGTGVTVVLPVPTSATHGKPISIVHADSGTTDVFLYVTGGLPMDTTSGTTDGKTLDAEGDSITVVGSYNTGVSYYILSSNVH